MARVLLAIAVGLGGVSGLGSSPAAALQMWRASRLAGTASYVDMSRFHYQVLLVDDDGVRARTCEALLARIAEWSDAGWWIYPHSASVGALVRDGERPLSPSLRAMGQRLRLCNSRLEAPAARLDPSDLDSYDLIVAMDNAVLEQVRLLRADISLTDEPSHTDEPSLLLLTDFLACGGERIDALDGELQSLLAPHFAEATSLLEIPSASPSRSDEWERLLAMAALCLAGMTVFLKETIDAGFVSAYQNLLATHFWREEHLALGWAEAEAQLRRHVITGGLDPKLRRDLWEAHCRQLKRNLSDPDSSAISDDSSTMD